ncbi:cytochrome c maturation protein CcmE [Haliangium ochraceum]|uniref:Cytochrome c-type biogenesis protein CcmE n=1 Tax=Haliangium ochraceum (strain DSM 14365 / JCM 11303 / SMP-2) TaxID=502025 RepID=D0LV11_HALO1|nr:cytochrome c maturation protein CcmE [Haliangium ochraceum]ACY15852.1 cytochrome c-type biogenesis protein CcmE [Haliangium ochraceum DSM 14365]
MTKPLIKVILTIAVVVGGVSLIALSSQGDVQYYKMVDELMVEPGDYTGKTLKVHGYVEAGTIDERIEDQQTKRTFILENKGQRLVVHHLGPKPDTFKDKSEVVAEGRLIQENGTYRLEAEELMAKCPSKYEGAEANRNAGQQEPTVF